MYLQYYHFTELPFSIAPDPHFIYMSERHQEGLAHLLYGINMGGGFVALTGEVGTGKTTLCRCLLEQLPANIDIALILNPKLNAVELLSTLCDELHIGYEPQQQTLKNFTDKINEYLLTAYANGRRTVLLIDEAQNLSMEVLEQIRLLTNLETSKTKLLQIILVGQPELQQLLQRQDLRQLNQRITARYHLLPLSLADTKAYIRHRLTVCNGNPNLFKEPAIRKVYHFSGGIPRIINILCDRALLGGYAGNARTISADIISKAASETLNLRGKRLTWLYLLGLTGIALAGGAYLFNQYLPVLNSPPSPLVAPVAAVKSPILENNLPLFNQLKPALPAQPSQDNAKPFDVWLANPALNLTTAMQEALKIWKKPVPNDKPLDCPYLATLGLHCLYDKSSWQDLLELNRPAILVFYLSREEKRYALLTGMQQGRAVFNFSQPVSFPLGEVLKLWHGHYLVLWQPPRPGLTELTPEQLSSNVQWLRQQIGTLTGSHGKTDSQSLLFDEQLKNQVINFQRQHGLKADGIAGARTLIHLDNRSGAVDSPHLQMTE